MNETMTEPVTLDEKEQMLQRKVHQRIEDNQDKWKRTISSMVHEANNVRNIVMPMERLRLGFVGHPVEPDGVAELRFGQVSKEDVFTAFEDNFPHIHQNAMAQMATKMGIPVGFAKKLASGPMWQREALQEVVASFASYGHNNAKIMLRVYDGTAKAVLSDTYKPMNMGFVYAAAVDEARLHGAVPYDGHHGSLDGWLEVIRPELIRVSTPNNGMVHMAYGIQLKSSDYGTSALNVNAFMLQGVCANGAVISRLKRMVHIGKRLDENIRYRDTTIQKELDATIAILRDHIKDALSPGRLRAYTDNIIRASNAVLTEKDSDTIIKTCGLSDDEQSFVRGVLMAGDQPDNGVVGALTRWKLGQAISLYDPKDGERHRDLMDIAGVVMEG